MKFKLKKIQKIVDEIEIRTDYINDVNILQKTVPNYHKRVFLESLHSKLNENAVNEHK